MAGGRQRAAIANFGQEPYTAIEQGFVAPTAYLCDCGAKVRMHTLQLQVAVRADPVEKPLQGIALVS